MFEEGTTTVAENQQRPQASWQQKQDTNHDSQTTGHEPRNTLDAIRNFKIEFAPNTKDIMNFTNQLAVMIRAGISLQEALESIGQQQENQKFKAVISNLKDKIEAGQSFSQALAEHPQVFTNIYINMVAAAEISGSLSEMLQKLSEYLNTNAETRSQIKGAMVYPAIIGCMAVSVTIFLLCFVLPKFGAIFEGKEHMLPASTKILMSSSTFLRSYWFFILPVISAALGALWYFIGTNVGRLWWDKTKLVLPLISKLCRNLYITRSLYTMGVLTHAGVPILDTISITAQVSGNVLYKNMWLNVYDDVRQGKKIASSLTTANSKQQLMPGNVVQMIRSGEDSGTLSSVLRDISDYYGKELKNTIKIVTSMIEPIMIVLMGALVGFIAMSIMLPIFKMSNLVTGK